jgi:hypothetical protein
MTDVRRDSQGPGRPRKVAPQRSQRVRERVEAFQAAEREFAKTDALLCAAVTDQRLEALYIAREELAREAAGLLFARLYSVPGSREMGRLATRRISALREVANLTLVIARYDSGSPSPERMGRILELLTATIDEAVASVLPADTAANFQQAWRARIAPFLAQTISER